MITVAFNDFGLRFEDEKAQSYLGGGLVGCIQAAHDLGFVAYQEEGVIGDLQTFGTVDVPAVRSRLQELQMEFHMHYHAADCCPDVFEFARKGPVYYRFREHLLAAIHFMHDVGGTVFTFHPPFVDTGINPEDVPIDLESRMQCIEVYDGLMRDVGELADEKGIKLGIESGVWGPPRRPWTTPFLTPKELDGFVKRPGMAASVGILAEISHLHHLDHDIPALIELWGDKVHDIHTSDAVRHHWTDKRHYNEVLVPETHQVVGQGTLDFRAAIEALVGIGYDGTLSLEIFPQHVKSLADSVTSREILESIIRDVADSSDARH